jgi:septum site-determining protein MinC
MPISQKNAVSFELKGSLFTLTVLHLFHADLSTFSAELRQQSQKTPNLFKNMPLVIDLQRLVDSEQEIDFGVLQETLRAHALIPVGVRHGSVKLHEAAQAAGLAVLSSQPTKAISETKSRQETPAVSPTVWVTKPVRSGQQIYARQADLVVLAPVSHGAELLADGSIHVYDCLRGRALAGINGDQAARIFCHTLEAQLVSIAGHYRLSESLPTIEAPMVQIYLQDDKVCIEGLPKNHA